MASLRLADRLILDSTLKQWTCPVAHCQFQVSARSIKVLLSSICDHVNGPAHIKEERRDDE